MKRLFLLLIMALTLLTSCDIAQTRGNLKNYILSYKDTKSRNDDSTSILRKKGKSKTRKQSKIVFHFNKGKSLSKKISDNYNNI